MSHPPQELHFRDSVLTMDPEHWLSPSYGGMSSRSELWMTCLAWSVVMMLLAFWLSSDMPLLLEVLHDLFFIVCFFPLLVRRARQIGATWYGGLVVAVGLLGVLDAALCHAEVYVCLAEVWAFLFFLLLLPLLAIGGTYSGRKTLLMRAAIAGDRELVERCLCYHPSGLKRLSEKGYTAADYARLRGHHELVAFLQAQAQNAGKICD